jgi:predicted Zn-dependent peptidase
MNRLAFLVLLSACLLLPAWMLAQSVTPSLAEFEKSVTEFTLPNGLKFIIVERHNVPTVAFHLYVDVGAVDEVTGITGVSHLFEHMAFKGTRTVGTRDYAGEKKAMEALDQAYLALEAERQKGPRAGKDRLKQLEESYQKAQEAADKFVVGDEFSEILNRSGAVGLNAGTGYDSTEYTFSLPSNKLELWFSMESGRFLDPVTRDFYKERNVVVEERRMRTESSPFGKLVEEFLAAAYKAHPYGQPVVGHFSEISRLRHSEADRYFRENYVPAAMTAVLVGDVNPKEAKHMAEIYFGRLPKRPRKESVRTEEPPQEGERRVEVEAQSQPFLLVGYHRPSIMDKDRAVFDAISDILGGGRTSWLYKSLVKEKKIAVAAQAISGIPGYKYPGLFLFLVVPTPGHTADENLKAVEEQIERLKGEKISAEQLEQVKTRTKALVLRSLRSNSGLAGLLAGNQVLEGDWRQIFHDIDEIGRVTADDLQRVAQTYFQKRNRTIGVIAPLASAAKPKAGD